MRTTDTAENVSKVFGDFEQIKSLVEGETAFVTGELTASEAEKKASELSETITSIRIFK